MEVICCTSDTHSNPQPQDTAPQTSAQIKWWETTWQEVVFSLWGDAEGGEQREARCSFLFPVFARFPVCLSLLTRVSFLSIVVPSLFASLSPYIFFYLPFSLPQRLKVFVSFHLSLVELTRVKKQWCTAWMETWWQVLLVSMKAHRRAWLLPDDAACVWTKTTHRCNPCGFEATPSSQWVPAGPSVFLTDWASTSQGGEDRYAISVKSETEKKKKHFSQSDSQLQEKITFKQISHESAMHVWKCGGFVWKKIIKKSHLSEALVVLFELDLRSRLIYLKN